MDDERGYVRIYREQEGFGYELSTYLQQPMADLFERMNGYASITAAREAAHYQLSAANQIKRLSRKPVRRRASTPTTATQTRTRSKRRSSAWDA